MVVFPREALLIGAAAAVLGVIGLAGRQMRESELGGFARSALEALAMLAALAALTLCLGELVDALPRLPGPEAAVAAVLLLVGLYLEPALTARAMTILPPLRPVARVLARLLIVGTAMAGVLLASTRIPLALDVFTLASGIVFTTGLVVCLRAQAKALSASQAYRRARWAGPALSTALLCFFLGTRARGALARYEVADYGSTVSTVLGWVELLGLALFLLGIMLAAPLRAKVSAANDVVDGF